LVQVKVLGQFSISVGANTVGPWPRPTAKRLCELVLLSPGRTVRRDVACEVLFPELGRNGARALSKALSMARAALSRLGERGASLLQADLVNIWASPDVTVSVDAERQEAALKAALDIGPGQLRDDSLVKSLSEVGALLADEPYADWALRAREQLEALRQDARLALARDRCRGFGRADQVSALQAWETCFAEDPTCEEAATALVLAYSRQGRRSMAAAAYEGCRQALEELGLRPSSTLGQAGTAALHPHDRTARAEAPTAPVIGDRGEERRLVTVLFVELLAGAGRGPELDPETTREVVGGALAKIVGEVEDLGGKVTSISSTGVLAVFGAPDAHEDDPERALRAAFRVLNGMGTLTGEVALRAGVETGPAVTGPIGGVSVGHYGAVGEVVSTAGALQLASRAGSVLVGPVTRNAAEGLFEWGPTADVAVSGGTRWLRASYLGRPKARAAGQPAKRGLVRPVPIVGRGRELALLRESLRHATGGTGCIVVMTGEPGLGKTRLVAECRRLFMGWVGAASGRLPLWLEGRAASYASAQPYGLYHQVLSHWVGTGPEETDDLAWPALERAVRATFAGKADDQLLALLAHVMGLRPRGTGPAAARLGPEALQQASFAALRGLISRLLVHGPTVLILEDLHWADPTSLRLTEELFSLSKQGPLLLVLTRRPEPGTGASALEGSLSTDLGLTVRRIELSPLAERAEEELARALVGDKATDEVIETIRRGADGNPLFLEERLSSLLETRVVHKGDDGHWRLDRGGRDELPSAIERMVRSRVDRLGPRAHDAIVAASVLGVEFNLEALGSVADIGDELLAAVSELCSVGLLVQLDTPGRPTYRFRHSLIQECTYKGIVKAQRQRLHARAASGLEGAAVGPPADTAAVLGRHFALAGVAKKAALYLELAGDNAVYAFANEEAVSSYGYALKQLTVEGGQQMERAAGVWFKLGQLFLRLRRYEEGRHALQTAGRHFPPSAAVRAADAYRLLSWIEVADRRRAAASEALGTADGLLEGACEKETDEWARTWVDVQLMRGFNYFYNDPELLGSVIARARPLVEARAGPKQRADFYTQVGYQRAAAQRFVVDDDVMGFFLDAWRVVEEAGLEDDIETNFVRAGVGYFRLIQGDVVTGQEILEAVVALARRAGDRSMELTCLPCLAWARLRQHDVVGARELARQSASPDIALPFPFPEMARAVLSWVAWKEDRYSEVEELAGEVLETTHGGEPPFPFAWICLWPLIAVRLAEGRTSEAITAARELLQPPQMRLPAELEESLAAALAAWEADKHALAGERLRKSVVLAERLSFA
jgi:DNA-binding SARP family transcriptional activator